MNLHVTHDNVFLDYFVKATEDLNLIAENRFCVYLREGVKQPALIKSKGVEYAEISKFRILIGDLKNYKTIYIHWMYDYTDSLVLSIPDEVCVVWCFWGGDGLELKELLPWVYQPKTYHLFKKTNKFNFSLSLPYLINQFKALRKVKRDERNHIEAIKRVDFFAHYLKQDYDKIKSVVETNMKFSPFFYAPCDMHGLSNFLEMNSKKDIFLGNSDTITNNHLEAIDALSKIDLADRKVICPLSYEKGQYATTIKKYGAEKLGKNFVPLLDFMPLEQYSKLVSQVGYAFLNHNRSQALGNIYMFFASGIKLFMSADSTLYHFFKENGFIVFSIQNDMTENIFKPLTEKEALANVTLLNMHFGKEAHLKNIGRLLKIEKYSK